MITEKTRLGSFERKRLYLKVNQEKDESVSSAPVFFEEDMNTIKAPCYFFQGRGPFCRAFLSVFYVSETEAELTIWQKKDTDTEKLFQRALLVCRQNGIERVTTVVDPKHAYVFPASSFLLFQKKFSEFFFDCPLNRLAVAADISNSEDISCSHEEEEGSRHYLLQVGHEVVAECRVTPFIEKEVWYLFDLQTKNGERRKGYATALLGRVARELLLNSGQRLRLQVSSTNEPAERLYRKLSFEVSEQRDYYEVKEISEQQNKDIVNKKQV